MHRIDAAVAAFFTHVARSVVGVSVCVSGKPENRAKTTEPIEMPLENRLVCRVPGATSQIGCTLTPSGECN